MIDYYHDESITNDDKVPKGLTDATSIQSIKIDVRPAMDSFESLFDRMIHMPMMLTLGNKIDIFYSYYLFVLLLST